MRDQHLQGFARSIFLRLLFVNELFRLNLAATETARGKRK